MVHVVEPHSVNIVVADETAPTRGVVARALERSGFRIIEAATGKEALSLALRRPDLMILDAQLPDMDALEVCRRLKSHPATADIPLLQLAPPPLADTEPTRPDGLADGVLTQPVDADELTATVRALLRIRSAEAALRESEERY